MLRFRVELGVAVGRATELPRSYNFTSHWVREASTADFAKLWAAEPAGGDEGGAGELSSRLSVLHYPGQAKPWKYVHLFSRGGLLSITQRYKAEGVDMAAMVLVYNIDTADAGDAARAALELCRPFDAQLELGSVLVPPAIPLVPPHMLAIVSFADEAAAQAASAALNGTNHAGRSLSVGGLAVEAFTQRQRFTKMFGRNAVATFERWWQVFEQT